MLMLLMFCSFDVGVDVDIERELLLKIRFLLLNEGIEGMLKFMLLLLNEGMLNFMLRLKFIGHV